MTIFSSTSWTVTHLLLCVFCSVTNCSTSPWVTPVHFIKLLDLSSWIWWSLQALQRKQKHSQTLGYHLDVIYFYAKWHLLVIWTEKQQCRAKMPFCQIPGSHTAHLLQYFPKSLFSGAGVCLPLPHWISCSFYQKLCFIGFIWSAAQGR